MAHSFTQGVEARTHMAQALTLVAHREGRRVLPPQAWANVLSFTMGWMPPAKARAFVERAHAAGILAQTQDGLALAEAVEGAPLGFRPDPDLAPGPAEEGFALWLARVQERTGRPREAVLGDVAALQRRLGGWLTADVALLWLARDAGLDVRAAAQRHGEALTSSVPTTAAR